MKQNTIPLLFAVFLIISVYRCSKQNENATVAKANINALIDSVSYYKNKLGTQTATIKTLQLSALQLQQTLINKDAELKKLATQFSSVKHVVKAQSKINFEQTTVKFAPPIIIGDSAIKFERTGKAETNWYSLEYKVNNDSLTINDLTTWTETTVITGLKRKWFLGKQVLVTEITNSNPYIEITDLKAAEVVISQPWYTRWYIWLAAGIAGGILIK